MSEDITYGKIILSRYSLSEYFLTDREIINNILNGICNRSTKKTIIFCNGKFIEYRLSEVNIEILGTDIFEGLNLIDSSKKIGLFMSLLNEC